MSHYKPYPEYRPSGVEWIGDVPSTWEVRRLRQVASFTNSGIDKKSYEDQEQVSLCNYTDVYYNEFITADMPFMQATASKDEIAQFTLKKGDLIITKDSEDPSDIGIPALVVEDAPGVVCGYHLTLIRSAELATARLLHRVLQSTPTHAYFYIESPGITRYGLGQDVIGDLRVCIPPERDIDRITDCIDRETKRIDSLIAKKTRFIELLKEKHQALITHAVTKGLDPNVKMRDSGVEWIGDVPHNWTLTTLKRVSSIRYGIGEPPPYKAEGVRLVRATNVNAGEIQERGMVFVDPNDIPAGRIVWLKSGDIIVVRSGAYTGDSAIVPEEYPSAIAGFDMVLRCTGAIPQFIQFLLLSPYVKVAQIDPQTMRAAQPHLNAEELGECVIAAPPLDEQEEIARYLIEQCGVIDLIARKTQHSIDLLRERRSAFITAAITGQIDIREVA